MDITVYYMTTTTREVDDFQRGFMDAARESVKDRNPVGWLINGWDESTAVCDRFRRIHGQLLTKLTAAPVQQGTWFFNAACDQSGPGFPDPELNKAAAKFNVEVDVNCEDCIVLEYYQDP